MRDTWPHGHAAQLASAKSGRRAGAGDDARRPGPPACRSGSIVGRRSPGPYDQQQGHACIAGPPRPVPSDGGVRLCLVHPLHPTAAPRRTRTATSHLPRAQLAPIHLHTHELAGDLGPGHGSPPDPGGRERARPHPSVALSSSCREKRRENPTGKRQPDRGCTRRVPLARPDRGGREARPWPARDRMRAAGVM